MGVEDYGVKRGHFQQHSSYIVTVSFIDGGNRTPEKTTDLSQFTEKLASSTSRQCQVVFYEYRLQRWEVYPRTIIK
jgi:hypothetical protein